jgi:hypothetical protein
MTDDRPTPTEIEAIRLARIAQSLPRPSSVRTTRELLNNLDHLPQTEFSPWPKRRE